MRNAEDFLQEYRRIRFQYDALYQSRIEAIRAAYSDSPAGNPPSVDNALEAHSRQYVVNAFLQALNWRMDVNPDDGLPNLVPEAPIESSLEGTTVFLDYLGTQREGCDPLLIVESKRPSSPLPQRTDLVKKSSDRELAPEPIESVLSAGLSGATLSGSWNKWLQKLKDYVQSAYDQRRKVPRRVVLTSGRWLIIFTDPSDSFLASGTRSPEKILVFSDKDAGVGTSDPVERHYREIFGLLEHQRVLDEVHPLTVAEIAFYIGRDQVDRLLHGLHLVYIEKPGFHHGAAVALSASPVIMVMPVIFLRSTYGAWLRVYSERETEVPHEIRQLPDHVREVHEIASRFLEEINARLGTNLTPATVESHYGEPDDFNALRGVVENPKHYSHYDEHVIVTGQHTHYFRLEPTVPDCPHHDWGKSNRQGRASLVSIMRRSTDPRAFFISSENNHCAHREVEIAKASPITPSNKDRCGPRSGSEFDAFCEIWRFEKYLCCRTCTFQGVCTKAEAFGLPCHLPETAAE